MGASDDLYEDVSEVPSNSSFCMTFLLLKIYFSNSFLSLLVPTLPTKFGKPFLDG